MADDTGWRWEVRFDGGKTKSGVTSASREFAIKVAEYEIDRVIKDNKVGPRGRPQLAASFIFSRTEFGTKEPVSLFRLLLLSLRPRRFLSTLSHPRVIFWRTTARRCICRQSAHPMRDIRRYARYCRPAGNRTATQSNAALIRLIARFIPDLAAGLWRPGGQRGQSLPPASPPDSFPRWPMPGVVPGNDAPAGFSEVMKAGLARLLDLRQVVAGQVSSSSATGGVNCINETI